MRRIAILALVVVAACGTKSNAGPTVTRPESVRIVGGTGGTTSIATVQTDAPNVATLKLPVADVWAALPTIFESMAVPIEHLDHQSRIIGNQSFRVRRKLGAVPLSRYIDCGTTQGGPSAETYEVHLTVLAQATGTEDPAFSRITTTVQALARPINFTGDLIRCSTTGALESRLVTALKAHTK